MTEFTTLLTSADVDRKIVGLVDWARAHYGIPYDCSGERACELMGLGLRRGSLQKGGDGALMEGHVVVNHALTWPARIEFTIFHEIVHHLLNEDGELIEFFTAALRNDPRHYEIAIERCCQQGAAEFLMPRKRVRELIGSVEMSVDCVEDICRETGASIIASALQLATCVPIDCFVVLCCNGPVPRLYPPYTGLHVEYAFPSWRGRKRYWLARFSQIANDHLIASAWQEQERIAGPSYVPFRSGKRMPCYCEAKLVGNRVISILYLEQPVPQGQQALPLFGM